LIRQICLLREKGEAARALAFEREELMDAVNEFRVLEGAQCLTDAALQAMFVAETARVADAAAMVELLLPHIREAIGSAVPLPTPAAKKSSPSPIVSTSTTTVARTAPGLADPPSIPDLLDAMLALERKGGR
jgi:hypothetical protein